VLFRSLRDGVIPPTINLDQPAEGYGLNFVTGKALAKEVKNILITARGFGGFNSALVIRRHTA